MRKQHALQGLLLILMICLLFNVFGENEMYAQGNDTGGVSMPRQIPELPDWVKDLSGKLVFQSDRDGDWEIYAMNVDGSHVVQLTHNSAADSYPVWSPDGEQIAFESNRDGNLEIYVMNADGSGQRRLSNHPANETNPAWSPDGKQIAFDSDRSSNREIYIVNADGNGLNPLTKSFGKNILPAWSPDGTHMAFTGNRYMGWNVYVMNLVTGEDQRITGRHGAYGACRPDWSPDGSKIAYVSQEADKHGDVWKMNPDGSERRQLTFDTEHADYYPAWSPDGRHLLYAKTDDKDRGNWELYLMSADGRRHARLTYHPARDKFPDWARGGISEDQVLHQRFSYEAEALSRNTGTLVEDADASQRKAGYAAKSDPAGFLAYGPYQLYSPGEYVASFRVKTDDVRTRKVIAELDVAADAGKKLLEKRELRGRDFENKNSYQVFQLPFFLKEEKRLEFRVYFPAEANVWLDAIAVTVQSAD